MWNSLSPMQFSRTEINEYFFFKLNSPELVSTHITHTHAHTHTNTDTHFCIVNIFSLPLQLEHTYEVYTVIGSFICLHRSWFSGCSAMSLSTRSFVFLPTFVLDSSSRRICLVPQFRTDSHLCAVISTSSIFRVCTVENQSNERTKNKKNKNVFSPMGNIIFGLPLCQRPWFDHRPLLEYND